MTDAPLLVFREIDLGRDGELCVRFRADSYVCGEGTAERFFARAGPGGRDYLARLAKYMGELPGSCVHAWLGEEIVGQVEMVRDPDDPTVGKVNLFYLRADHRGRGLGGQLRGMRWSSFGGSGSLRRGCACRRRMCGRWRFTGSMGGWMLGGTRGLARCAS